MDFYNNFITMCDKKQIPAGTVCKECGLSESSHSKWKNSVPKCDTILKLATYLGCSTDRLLTGKEHVLNLEHENLIEIYEKLSSENKKVAYRMLQAFYDVQTEQEVQKDCISIKHSLYKVSAGFGCNLDDDEWEEIMVEKTPESLKADFAITIDGDSMLPYYNDKDIVLVKSQNYIDIGDIGIFIQDGKGFIKEKGTDRLISLNEDYPDIYPDQYDDIHCVGLVLGTV